MFNPQSTVGFWDALFMVLSYSRTINLQFSIHALRDTLSKSLMALQGNNTLIKNEFTLTLYQSVAS
jgi:adenine C2-methylase RlmN of 23S rRNA A2503 and tRNA A37